jgi:hypothetical protein
MWNPEQEHGKSMAIPSVPTVSILVLTFFSMQVNYRKVHFKSWHGLLGAEITAAAMLAASGGLVSFRRIGLLAKLPAHVQPLVKAAHRYSGSAVWLAAMFNTLLGLQTGGAGPRVVLHCIDAAAIIVMTAAQLLLLLPSASDSITSLPDAGKLV